MLNFYVYNVLQGIWNRSRYDVAVSRSFQGHGKVKGQTSALGWFAGGTSPVSRLPAQPAFRQQGPDHPATLLLRLTVRLTD